MKVIGTKKIKLNMISMYKKRLEWSGGTGNSEFPMG